MSDLTLPIDYYANVTLSNDKLNAFIHFNNCDENFSCTMEQLETLLKSHQIVHGIHYDVLSKLVRSPREYLLSKTMIASGNPSRDGEDGTIKYLYDLDNENKKPMEMEDGTVDFKEVTSLNNVRKGELIARRILSTEGVPGKAVTGEVLLTKSGKEVHFKIGKNVVVDAQQMALYAAIDGMIVKTDREKINVFPIYEVNGDVDYHIGNIDFIGTVVIRGSIPTGFKVKAAGDIRVTGGVEGAELEAAGSIEISAGILGQNKGFIKAGKNVKSSFIQDGNVEAGEDIIVSQSIMHSNVRAGRNVICKGVKGLIVGGTVQSGEKVQARTIGNSVSTNTIIEVGVLPELRNELLQLRIQIRTHNETLDKTDKALNMLDQMAAAGQLSSDKIAMRIKLGHSKKQIVDEQEQTKERILEIEKSLEDTDLARVEVSSTIYGGTKIVIGRYTKFIKDPAPRVYFKLFEGDISMLPNV